MTAISGKYGHLDVNLLISLHLAGSSIQEQNPGSLPNLRRFLESADEAASRTVHHFFTCGSRVHRFFRIAPSEWMSCLDKGI